MYFTFMAAFSNTFSSAVCTFLPTTAISLALSLFSNITHNRAHWPKFDFKDRVYFHIDPIHVTRVCGDVTLSLPLPRSLSLSPLLSVPMPDAVVWRNQLRLHPAAARGLLWAKLCDCESAPCPQRRWSDRPARV